MQQQEPRKALQLYLSMPIFAWALFDLANTIFSSNINTIFFPFYMNDTLGTDEVKQQVASSEYIYFVCQCDCEYFTRHLFPTLWCTRRSYRFEKTLYDEFYAFCGRVYDINGRLWQHDV